MRTLTLGEAPSLFIVATVATGSVADNAAPYIPSETNHNQH